MKAVFKHYDVNGNFVGCTTNFICRHSDGCDSCPYKVINPDSYGKS